MSQFNNATARLSIGSCDVDTLHVDDGPDNHRAAKRQVRHFGDQLVHGAIGQ